MTPTQGVALTQDLLRGYVARRIIRARPELAGSHNVSTMDGLLGAEADIAARSGTAAIAVVRRFDLERWVRGTVAFAMGLDRTLAARWRQSFTKTLFLAGNPVNLAERFAFDQVDDTGMTAWIAPAPAAAHLPIRRLLRAFVGSRQVTMDGEVVVDLPGGPVAEPVRRVLCMVGPGPTVTQTMINVTHLLVEAVLDGVVGPDDRLTLRQVPRLIGVGSRFDALRVDVDPTDPGRLHALMGLTKEVDGPEPRPVTTSATAGATKSDTPGGTDDGRPDRRRAAGRVGGRRQRDSCAG